MFHLKVSFLFEDHCLDSHSVRCRNLSPPSVFLSLQIQLYLSTLPRPDMCISGCFPPSFSVLWFFAVIVHFDTQLVPPTSHVVRWALILPHFPDMDLLFLKTAGSFVVIQVWPFLHSSAPDSQELSASSRAYPWLFLECCTLSYAALFKSYLSSLSPPFLETPCILGIWGMFSFVSAVVRASKRWQRHLWDMCLFQCFLYTPAKYRTLSLRSFLGPCRLSYAAS